jgi:hypothetical protein
MMRILSTSITTSVIPLIKTIDIGKRMPFALPKANKVITTIIVIITRRAVI